MDSKIYCIEQETFDKVFDCMTKILNLCAPCQEDLVARPLCENSLAFFPSMLLHPKCRSSILALRKKLIRGFDSPVNDTIVEV